MSLKNGGRTALSIAAEKKDDPLLWALIENNPSNVDLADVNSRTPLSFAAGVGSIFGIEALLEHGADVDAQDMSGRTPLSWAAAGGHTSAAKILLRNNVQSESPDIWGKTPLIYACISGHADMVALLLEYNHPLIIKSDNKKMSPLAHAAANGHNAVIEILIPLDTVIRDWTLQGWKERTLKRAARARATEKWDLREELRWELKYSRMPQTHALISKHRDTFKLLYKHWRALKLSTQAHLPSHSSSFPSSPSSLPLPSLSLLLSSPTSSLPTLSPPLLRTTAIGMRRKGVFSPQEQANPGENEPCERKCEDGDAEESFKRAELEAGYQRPRRIGF